MFSLRLFLIACAVVAPLTLAITGCAGHVGVGVGYYYPYDRVYDPSYYDYHVFGPAEYGYYNTWLGETHRPHRDFDRLKPQEQREYWGWRHQSEQRPARRAEERRR